jgi:hypothetical protein
VLTEKEEQRAQAFLDASDEELRIDVEYYESKFFASVKWLAEKLIEVNDELSKVALELQTTNERFAHYVEVHE